MQLEPHLSGEYGGTFRGGTGAVRRQAPAEAGQDPLKRPSMVGK